MPVRPVLAIIAGAVVVSCLGVIGARATAPGLAEALEREANEEVSEAGGRGVYARFATPGGYASRHPVLSGGENLDEGTRDAIAKAVGAVGGVGGVRWEDGTANAESGTLTLTPLHCQEDVEALLRARSIRFEESSSNIDTASRELLDEVAMALRPCLGSIIAVTGHTDASGPEPGNLALSQERADSVRQALMRRGIPSDGLRARGVGSKEPVEGLAPDDPANRRIEFSVIATVPLAPTPVDTPGPR